ncbi:MAG: radical SAM protein [Desulfovibrionaceae bacterium]
MATLRVALTDVRHRTMGLHSYQMPLGIGLIAAYAKKHMADDIEVRLYKYSEPLWDGFEEFQPHVVGGSFFSWNRRLALHVLKKAKRLHPACHTLLGGPELELESDKREAFLREHPYVDICCVGEGEATCLEIFQTIAAGADPRRKGELLSTFYLDPDSGALVEQAPRPRISPLDEVPSPYTSGLFDKFFDDYLHPFVESHRGCPFTCRFCHMGLQKNSHITFQSVARTMEDLEYCAKRYAGRHDIQLCIGDNNFAMFPKDVELAKGIRRLQDTYDWPRYIVMSTGKNRKERMVEISSILKWGLPFNMAAQSLYPPTLEAIGRKNISLTAMRDTLMTVKNAEADSYTEIIMPLPEETRESFEDGLRMITETNLNWMSILTLRLLNGTWLTLQDTIDRYKFDIRHRVICRQFGEYDGERIIEIEGAVVGTSTMSFEDYCYLSEIKYVIQVIYNADTFNPIRRFLIEHGLDVWEWIKLAHQVVLEKGGVAKRQMDAFLGETKGELFDSVEELTAYYAEDANYQKLLRGEEGDNLVNKYSVLAGSDGFTPWLEVAVKAARLLAARSLDPAFANKALDNLRRYIELMYDFAPFFHNLPEAGKHVDVLFDWDIKKWMGDKGLVFADVEGRTIYDVFFSEEQVRQIGQMIESSHDISFTIQRVYRDKNYSDLMPAVQTLSSDCALYNALRRQ